jgi:hypothetical protein
MERIHDAAMKVLKGMDTWEIETYFAEMRRNGFEVEPTYDSQGVCRGYSIGEKLYDLDGNYSSTVMYKASAKKFCHGRDLTVSKLYGTWQKLHPEMEALRAESNRWQQSADMTRTMAKPAYQEDDEEYLAPPTHKPTEAERERDTAIWLAFMSIRRFVNNPFKTEFSPLDKEDILPEGIVAKAIDMEQEAGSSFCEDNLKNAVRQFLNSMEGIAERVDDATEDLMDVVANIALPETLPSLGGGQSNNDLPKKKDDEWKWWKNNGFVRNQRSKSRKR